MRKGKKWVAILIAGVVVFVISFADQFFVKATEVKIPYNPSENSLSLGTDEKSLCLHLRNVGDDDSEGVPQNVVCSDYIQLTFTIQGLDNQTRNSNADVSYVAQLVGIVSATQDGETHMIPFCNSDEDAISPGKVTITGDGTYTVRTELPQQSDEILFLKLDTNIDVYSYQKDGDVNNSGITITVDRLVTGNGTETKSSSETKKEITTTATQTTNLQTAALQKEENVVVADAESNWQTTATTHATTTYATTTLTTTSATTTTMTTTTTTTTTEEVITMIYTEPSSGYGTTTRGTTTYYRKSSGYHIAALNNVDTINGIGETLQLFVGYGGISSALYTDNIPAWTSFQPDVATVDENGMVTAVSDGTAVIAAVLGSNALSIEITVTAPVTTTIEYPATSTMTTVTTDPYWTETQTALTTTTAKPKVYYDPEIVAINNIRKITIERPQLQLYVLNVKDPKPTWTSFTPSIASVDENGLVTGGTSGTAIIGALLEDGTVCQYKILVDDDIQEVITTEKTVPTTTTTTTTKDESKDALKGDINGDGAITVEDAVLVLEYYAKQAAGLNPTWEELLGS